MGIQINKALIQGNLGRDPEIRTTQDGTKVANLSIATSEFWRDKNSGERRERTEWHRVVVFGDGLINKVIEPYLKKGDEVYIEAKIQTRKWSDQSGVEKYTTELVVNGYQGKLEFNSKSNGGSSTPAGNENNAGAGAGDNELDDEIPF